MRTSDYPEREFSTWLDEERALMAYEDPSCDAVSRLPSPAYEDRSWEAIERDDVEFYSQHEALR